MRVMKTPRSMEISITNRCNLRCSYCNHFGSPGEGGAELPFSEWKQFIEELSSCAVMSVTLGGGEPFLRDDITMIIGCIVEGNMRFNILSNGTLVDDDIARFIASTGRCNHVQVSVDGSTAEAHDVLRGNGSFSRSVAGFRRLRQHGVRVQVRVTIHRHNMDDLEAIARLLLEELQLPSFWTNSASYLGLCMENARDIQLSVEERSRVMETLYRLNKVYGGRIKATAGPLRDAVRWLRLERLRREGGRPASGSGFLADCGKVMSEAGVRADGVMVPCLLMGHIELGRINRDRLATVWRDHPDLYRMRRRRSISLADLEFCDGCEYVPYCGGNCPAIAFNRLGRDDLPNPDDCLRRFLDAGGRLPRE